MSHSPPPLVVVTLPARSVEETHSQAVDAASAGADVAEVRFDRWPAHLWSEMGRLFPAPLPLMATLRSRREGGEGPESPEERQKWRTEVARHPFAWFDEEVNTDSPGAPSTLRLPVRQLVRSAHLSPEAAPADVHRLLARVSAEPGIVKVVVPATVHRLLFDLLPELPPAGEGRFVVLTTGPSGPLLRAWSRRFGLAMVFASLPEAPGRRPIEAAQIPADRLKPFLARDPPAPLFALLGRPVSHSLSPTLHHRWMGAEGRVGLYIALELENDAEVLRCVPALFQGGFRGFNVTHPFKETILEVADTWTVRAQECGCANLVTMEPSGIEADNTDLYAILRRLRELEADGRWDGSDLLIVGAGGAAKAGLAAARSMGIRPRVLARDLDKGRSVARTFGADLAAPADARASSLVVHATPAGTPGSAPLGVELAPWLGSRSYVLDFVYGFPSGEVRSLCEKARATYEDGRRLLAYSAAASYERWWGSTLSPEQIGEAVRGAP